MPGPELDAPHDPRTPAAPGAEGCYPHRREAGRDLAVPAKVRLGM